MNIIVFKTGQKLKIKEQWIIDQILASFQYGVKRNGGIKSFMDKKGFIFLTIRLDEILYIK